MTTVSTRLGWMMLPGWMATGRLVMAQTLVDDLPGALALWEAGAIDSLKAKAITEASYLLAPELRPALEARALRRAGTQTIAQLRAALTRAVLAVDRLKTHAPGWDVEQHPDGRITWTTPTGRVDASHPHDYRPDSHPPPDDDPPPF
ncbi:MAG: hypothetical protein WAK86_10420 [Pseudonocardiaceae bacterium]